MEYIKDSRIQIIKEELFGNDVEYALENFDGMLWCEHDINSAERFLSVEHIDTDGLEIAIDCWLGCCLNNLNKELSREERDIIVDMIVSDLKDYYDKHKM